MKRYLTDIDLSNTKIIHTDVAIIGSGIAGLYASYHLDSKLECTLFTKQNIDDSSSTLAQGGIAAVTEKDDRIQYHFEDTIKAGAGLCDEEASADHSRGRPERYRRAHKAGRQLRYGC